MSIKIKFEKFDPLKIEIVGKKLKAKFFDLDLPTRGQTNDDSNLPHQDLIDAVKALGADMARTLGLTAGYELAIDEIRGNLDATKKAKDGLNAAELSCDVTSISWHGEKRMSIQLKGPVVYKDGKQTQTTPHISLDTEKNEFAKDINLKLDGVKKELWAYLFAGKYTVSEKKKKEEQNEKATAAFENAIANNGEFQPQ